MKHPFFYLLSLAATIPASHAQSTAPNAGIYRSAADFRLHQLTWETPARQAAFRVRLYQWPRRSYLTVVHGAHQDTLPKTAVYGYRNRHGQVYRLASNQRWLVLNPTEDVLLYRVEQPPVGKTPGYVRLYFSASATAPVQPLTRRHLMRAFPTNYRLHELLDAQGAGGSSLAAWDEVHGMTTLNWLVRYSQSIAQGR